jgi:hypothetical protein
MDSEPMTTTDINGSFTLTIKPVHRNHPNFSSADLIVYGGQDSDTLLDFNNKIRAPFDGNTSSINVTPITTMVAMVRKNGKDINKAKELVANMLGVTKKR